MMALKVDLPTHSHIFYCDLVRNKCCRTFFTGLESTVCSWP